MDPKNTRVWKQFMSGFKQYFFPVLCCTFFLCLYATNTAPDSRAYHCQCCVSSRRDIDNTYLETDKVKERDEYNHWIKKQNKTKNPQNKPWQQTKPNKTQQQKALKSAQSPHLKIQGTLNFGATGGASWDKLALKKNPKPFQFSCQKCCFSSKKSCTGWLPEYSHSFSDDFAATLIFMLLQLHEWQFV